MKYTNRSFLAVCILPVVSIACGSSSGSPSEDETPFFDQEENSTVTSADAVDENTQEVVPVNPLAILPTDVYDPFNVFNQNACSAPYYELVSGIYEGTVDVFEESRIGLSDCSWNVVIKYERFYRGSRGSCGVRMEYTSTLIEETPVVEDIFTPDVEEEDDITVYECFEGTVVGELDGVSRLELTDLVFPVEANTTLRNRIDGGGILVFPNSNARTLTWSGFRTSQDGSGSLNFVGRNLENLTVNITKTGSDLDE